MARFLVVLLVVFLMAVPGIVFAGDAEAVAEKDAVDDWYGMLEVQGGTTLETKTNTFRPYIAGKFGGWKELTGIVGTEFDVDEETEAKGPVTGLVGVTYNLGNLKDHGVEVSWARHFGLNAGLGVTYNWIEGEWGWRAMLSAVDLSFSGGGADRQKSR